jgi:hypothetical protein
LAILTLNALVLLLVLDLAAWTALRALPPGRYAGSMHVAWYDSQPWYQQYRREAARASEMLHYEPYVMWAGTPFTGRYVNVGASGRRATPGAACGQGAWQLMMLGGSTMWGVGAPDSGTIPAILQRLLSAASSTAVCTENLGERAYVSTQELVRLEREIQRGRVPHAVVFYDGINDVINGWRYAAAGAHNHVDGIALKLEGSPFTLWLDSWHLPRLVRALALRRRTDLRVVRSAPPETDTLSTRIAGIWTENWRMAAALGARYGFWVGCYLQPALAAGNKPLTDAERASLATMPAGQRETFRRTYALIRGRPPRDLPFGDLSDAFDSLPAQLYLDWYHVTPPANEAVARRLARDLALAPGFPARRQAQPPTAATRP